MRAILIAAGLVLAVLAAAYVAYTAFLTEPEPIGAESAAEAPVPEDVQGERIKLVKASGRVEAGSASGGWREMKAGATLPSAASVRTDNKGEAELDIGDGGRLTLAGQSELTLRESTKKGTRFRLERGRVRVKRSTRGKDLRIDAANTEAHVSSDEGSFAVTTDGLGTLAVAVTAGNAKLATPDGEKVIESGHQSVAFNDGTASAVAPIPKALLLKVGKIPNNVRKKRAMVIKGVTEAGAIVRVNGVTAKVDRRGRFQARVRLKEGANELIVLSEGVGGKKREMKLDPVTVDTHAPGSKVETKWE